MSDLSIREDVLGVAGRYGLPLTSDEVDAAVRIVEQGLAAQTRLDAVEAWRPSGTPTRGPGRAPVEEENALGAWAWRCEIKGAASGRLAGRTMVIKDSISVAGLPMDNGTSVLDGFVPQVDATVVRRVLDAGATIVGKAVCEALCLSGGGHTAHSGPVRNPYDPLRLAGGSSSGCAALVAAGAVDYAIGGDNGGSVRVPAAWCGICGLKPTWGLVPYTGAMPLVPMADHLGPMARDAAGVRAILEVLAGPDGCDPRQARAMTLAPSRFERVADLRVGLLAEGFATSGVSDEAVDAVVRDAVDSCREIGCHVSEASVPLHAHAKDIIALFGDTIATVVFEESCLADRLGGYSDHHLVRHFARAWRERVRELPPTAKLRLVTGTYFRDTTHGALTAKAQNLIRTLSSAYDRALEQVDVLAMPTTRLAQPVPEPDAPLATTLSLAWGQTFNATVFNFTGHPAITVPCGMIDGLPVGMMLVGRVADDMTVVRAAEVFQDYVYRVPPPCV